MKFTRGEYLSLPAVFVEVALCLEGHVTDIAGIWSLVGMCPDMLLKHGGLGATHIAIRTHVSIGSIRICTSGSVNCNAGRGFRLLMLLLLLYRRRLLSSNYFTVNG